MYQFVCADSMLSETFLSRPHIQGCESEITSMVKEARRKTSQCLDTTLLALGHMAVVTGMSLNVTGLGAQAVGKVRPPIIELGGLCLGTVVHSTHAPSSQLLTV